MTRCFGTRIPFAKRERAGLVSCIAWCSAPPDVLGAAGLSGVAGARGHRARRGRAHGRGAGGAAADRLARAEHHRDALRARPRRPRRRRDPVLRLAARGRGGAPDRRRDQPLARGDRRARRRTSSSPPPTATARPTSSGSPASASPSTPIDTRSIADVFASLVTVGDLTGRGAAARALAAGLEHRRAAVAARLAGARAGERLRRHRPRPAHQRGARHLRRRDADARRRAQHRRLARRSSTRSTASSSFWPRTRR